MSLAVGDRVQPHEAVGKIEEIRPSSDGSYMVAEVLWDTGARSPEPLDWLDPELETSPVLRPASSASKNVPYKPRLRAGVPAQPLYKTACIDCGRRWVNRKAVASNSETVCAGCFAELSPGPTWTVTGDGPTVLVCNDCAVHCHECRPVDTRLQWGDSQHPPAYFRKLAAEGKLDPPTAAPSRPYGGGRGKARCRCGRIFSPTRRGQKFHSKACARRNRRNANLAPERKDGQSSVDEDFGDHARHEIDPLSVTHGASNSSLEKVCAYEHCKVVFIPLRRSGRYHSDACRQAAYRTRRKVA
jgi:hypothetical protein